MTVRFDTLESPLGQLLMTAGDRGVTGVYLEGGRHAPVPRPDWSREPGSFTELAGQLTEYFRGSRTEFTLPLDPSGTPFQLRVWEALRTIPYGTTASYRELASRIGQPAATRAVGLANGRNPLSIVVPCHRVIGADGSLTGYAGGLERKRTLLDLERTHRR